MSELKPVIHRQSLRKSFRALSFAALGSLLGGAWACSSSDEPSPPSGAGASSGGATSGAAGAAVGGAGASSGGAGAGSAGAPLAGAGGAVAGSGGTAGSSGSAGSGGAAAGSGGNAGSNGGAPAYNPCPSNGDTCRVMPLGDSVTDGCCAGNGLKASYRPELFHQALSNDKKLTFVGSGSNGPNMVDAVSFPKKHEGHPGWTIADGGGRDGLQDMIVGWLNATPPDIVTLMIGTNDVNIQLDLPNAPKRLGTLIDTITQTKPNALVVVARILPTKKDDINVRVRAYNDAMPALVKARADAGKHVILVDIYSAFTKNTAFKTELMNDDLHPNEAGNAVMAKVWWDAIGKLLPAK